MVSPANVLRKADSDVKSSSFCPVLISEKLRFPRRCCEGSIAVGSNVTFETLLNVLYLPLSAESILVKTDGFELHENWL